MLMGIPYESATSGDTARGEITKLLRRMGCDEIGFMDRFAEKRMILMFVHRGRAYKLEASGLGWQRWFLRENPHTSRHRKGKAQYEADALAQGMIAINSVLRDHCKSLLTMIECEMMPFEEAMLGHMLLGNGDRVVDHLIETKLLSPPEKRA